MRSDEKNYGNNRDSENTSIRTLSAMAALLGVGGIAIAATAWPPRVLRPSPFDELIDLRDWSGVYVGLAIAFLGLLIWIGLLFFWGSRHERRFVPDHAWSMQQTAQRTAYEAHARATGGQAPMPPRSS